MHVGASPELPGTYQVQLGCTLESVLERHDERVVHLHEARSDECETYLAPPAHTASVPLPWWSSRSSCVQLVWHSASSSSWPVYLSRQASAGLSIIESNRPSVPSSLQFCVVVLEIPVNENQVCDAAVNKNTRLGSCTNLAVSAPTDYGEQLEIIYGCTRCTCGSRRRRRHYGLRGDRSMAGAGCMSAALDRSIWVRGAAAGIWSNRQTVIEIIQGSYRAMRGQVCATRATSQHTNGRVRRCAGQPHCCRRLSAVLITYPEHPVCQATSNTGSKYPFWLLTCRNGRRQSIAQMTVKAHKNESVTLTR